MTSTDTTAFPPKGALRRFAFPKLVREIARGKVTGSLYLLNGQTKKVVFFEQGQPVFVRSNVLAECLGQVLSGEGLITQEQCEQTLEAIRRTGKKQGELLVEMGILSEGNLRYGLAAQLRAKLYDIFAWDDGRYQFKTDAPNNQFGIRLDARPEAVIIGAILDRYDEERAEKLLGPEMDRYLVYGEDAPLDVTDLDLLPEERYFVECVDGSRTVSQCVRDELAQSVPSPHALVYGLIQAGVVEVREGALESRPRPPAPNYAQRPPDEELAPAFEPHNVVTEYEDTPLPGELPQIHALLGDHEDDFADVEALQTGTGVSPVPIEETGPGTSPALPEELIAAEPDQVEETFDDDELIDDSGPDVTMVAGHGDETHASATTSEPDEQDEATKSPETSGSQAAEPPPMLVDESPDDELVDPLEGLSLDDLDDLDAAPEPVPPPDLGEMDADPEPLDLRDPTPEPEPEPEEEVLDLEEVEEVEEVEELEELDLDGLEQPSEPPMVDLGAELAADFQAQDEDDEIDLGAELAADLEADDIDLGSDFEDEPDVQADPGATRADPLPPMAVNRDLGGATPLREPQQDAPAEPEPELDAEAPLDDLDIDDDLLMSDPADARELISEDSLDNIELPQDDELEIDDDLAIDPDAPLDDDGDGGSLMGLDELDDVELSLGDSPAQPNYDGPEATFQESQDPEMVGAMRFNEAETALGEQRFPDAVALLESAYENGFDVAELHAMLAFARFMAAGQDLETAQHAFELLDYAESMDPSLDLVWAYRGSLHHALSDDTQARNALQRALELNPYCELAIQVMDRLG